jgi:hypothetical protein
LNYLLLVVEAAVVEQFQDTMKAQAEAAQEVCITTLQCQLLAHT